MCTTELIRDREICRKEILATVPQAQSFLWLATADIKDLHVGKAGRMVPFLEILSDLVRMGSHCRERGRKQYCADVADLRRGDDACGTAEDCIRPECRHIPAPARGTDSQRPGATRTRGAEPPLWRYR